MNFTLTHAAKKLLLTAALPLLGQAAGAHSVEFFRKPYTVSESRGRAIALGWDNNLYIAGNAASSTNATTGLLLTKTTPAGNLLWSVNYGFAGMNTYATCVLTPASNEVMVAGYAEDTTATHGKGYAFLMQFDASGMLQWEKTYPRTGMRTSVADIKRLNNGYALCGMIADTAWANADGWLLRTDLNGDTLWSGRYGGASYDELSQIERAPGGGFILAGGSYTYRSGSSSCDGWLVRTDDLGRQQWMRNYGVADKSDWIRSIAAVGNAAQPDGYVFVGEKNASASSLVSDLFICRLDTAGNVLWDRSMHSSSGYAEGFAVEPTYNGTYYIAASELTAAGAVQLLTMNIDSMGNKLNLLRHSNGATEAIVPRAMHVNTLDDVYITGHQYTPSAGEAVFLTRIRNISDITATAVPVVQRRSAITVAPNPATTGCTVTSADEAMLRIVLRDAAGRTLRDITSPDPHAERIPVDDLPRGTVLLTVYTAGIAPVTLTLVLQ